MCSVPLISTNGKILSLISTKRRGESFWHCAEGVGLRAALNLQPWVQLFLAHPGGRALQTSVLDGMGLHVKGNSGWSMLPWGKPVQDSKLGARRENILHSHWGGVNCPNCGHQVWPEKPEMDEAPCCPRAPSWVLLISIIVPCRIRSTQQDAWHLVGLVDGINSTIWDMTRKWFRMSFGP